MDYRQKHAESEINFTENFLALELYSYIMWHFVMETTYFHAFLKSYPSGLFSKETNNSEGIPRSCPLPDFDCGETTTVCFLVWNNHIHSSYDLMSSPCLATVAFSSRREVIIKVPQFILDLQHFNLLVRQIVNRIHILFVLLMVQLPFCWLHHLESPSADLFPL